MACCCLNLQLGLWQAVMLESGGAVLNDGHHSNLSLLTHSTISRRTISPSTHLTHNCAQAAWLLQAECELQRNFSSNFPYHPSASVPLRLPSIHNRHPFEQTSRCRRRLKGLCHTLALYPDPCLTMPANLI